MLHDRSMSSEKLSKPESEIEYLKRKYDDLAGLINKTYREIKAS